MCPICLTTAMLIAGGVTASGGIAAVVIRKFTGKSGEDNFPASSVNHSKEDHYGH